MSTVISNRNFIINNKVNKLVNEELKNIKIEYNKIPIKSKIEKPKIIKNYLIPDFYI